MVKRFASILLCMVLVCTVFCGCNVRRGLDDGYILTAIGFDFKNDVYTTFCELTVIPDRQDEDIKTTTFTASGNTPEGALYNLSLNFQKAVYFDHCAALLIGNGVEGASLGSVIAYCAKEKNINPTLYTAYCEDIGALLKTETSAAAVGYHIMNLLRHRERESGIDFKSKLYEIATQKGDVTQTFTLPVFKGGEEVVLTGATVFKDNNKTATMNNDEYTAYSFLTERFKRGRISLYGEFADIKRVKYDFKVKTSEQKTDASIDIKLHTKDKSKGFEGVMKVQLQMLSDTLIGKDVLFIGERARIRGIDTLNIKNEDIKFMLEARV
ncbi:MAG: hypothetical protein U0L84_02390 [Acutalibacteraceae bacterium]|nr:hypothetical protein [Acutalibacteraceae bacterium]